LCPRGGGSVAAEAAEAHRGEVGNHCSLCARTQANDSRIYILVLDVLEILSTAFIIGPTALKPESRS
jgi:hypothetical protein